MPNRLLTDHSSTKAEKRKELENKQEERRKRMKDDRKYGGDYNNDPQMVGVLKLEHRKDKRNILITLDTIYWIGRSEKCDLTIKNRSISHRHIRFYAVRTTTNLSLAVLHDTSTNGYIINGEKSGIADKALNGKVVSTRSRVLRDGDVLELPGYDGIFTYHQQPDVKALTQELSDKFQLFHSSDTSLNISIHPWVIHNYPLGNGSWGIVNIGSHKHHSSVQVAIKTVEHNPFEQGHIERMKFEIQVHKALDHPNILKLLDYIINTNDNDNDADGDDVDEDAENVGGKGKKLQEGNGRIHMVLELVTGGDLWSYIDKHHSLQENEVRWIGWQMISGLKYIHAKGIAHRDIKPENILLHTSCAYPRILIGDFGSSTSKLRLFSDLSKGDSHQRQYTKQGTTDYFPYDQLKGIVNIENFDAESNVYHGERRKVGDRWWKEEIGMDIWATGVTLYFCATHHSPYCHIDQNDARYYGRQDTVVPISGRNQKRYTGDRSISENIREIEDEDISMGDRCESIDSPIDNILDDDPIDEYPSQRSTTPKTHNPKKHHMEIDELDLGDGDIVNSGLDDRLGELNIHRQTRAEEQIEVVLHGISSREGEPSSSRQNTLVPLKGNYTQFVLSDSPPNDSRFSEIVHQIEVLKTYGIEHWPETHIWSNWSKEGKQFIDDLLDLDPSTRIQSSEAHRHPWFENNQAEIEEIHEKVMVKGEVIRWLI